MTETGVAGQIYQLSLFQQTLVKISVDTSGLIAGSYLGTVSADAPGYTSATIEVNLLVSFAGALSKWEPADVRFSGFPLAIDDAEQRLFYSIGPGFKTAKNHRVRLSYDANSGYGIGINGSDVIPSGASHDFNSISYASAKEKVQLYRNGRKIGDYTLLFSNLPVISMEAAKIVDEPDSPGVFQFVSREWNQATAYLNMGIEYRGASSQRQPKKPYAIEFTDSADLSTADGLDVDLLGLRDDDDWILDPAYRDHFFVRNLVAMDIWNDMRDFAYIDDSGKKKGQGAIRGELVEVVRDNQYQGVHVLEEKLDRKLLSLKKGTDSLLYKARGNLGTLYFPDKVESAFEQKYPKFSDLEKLEPLEDLVTFIDTSSNADFVAGIADRVDIDNIVDFWLVTLVTAATDTLKKNYYIYRNETGKFHFTLWDYDTGFGMRYDGAVDARYARVFPVERNQLIYRLSQLTATGFNAKVKARWAELRQSLYTVDAITARFQAYYDQLVPIPGDTNNPQLRNRSRWPGTGGAGRRDRKLGTVAWIKRVTQTRLAFVDENIAAQPD